MKNYSSGVMIFTLAALYFCALSAMPGFEVDSGMPVTTPSGTQLDKKVTKDLAKLRGKFSIKGYLGVLNPILDYVGTQAISPQSQIDYCNAVRRFDIFARRFRPTKDEIRAMDRFLKNLQVSPLLNSSAVSDVSAAIKFWEDAGKKYGISPYKISGQRRVQGRR